MALIGSINNWGEIQGQINDANGVLTGVISSAELIGGQVVGMRGLKGDKGDTGNTGATGADGFSPSASVSKVGDTTTITITDKDGTTTASVNDGEMNVQSDWNEADSTADDFIKNKPTIPAQPSDIGAQEALVSGTNIKTINNESLLGSGNIDIQGGGASAFIAEYGVTTYADVKDAYDEDAIILCTVDDSGNTAILQLAYFDDSNDTFYFAQPNGDGWHWASVAIDDTWDDGSFQFATTDTATQLRNGLMDALDKQKLDGIASGAEVNVQSDWNEADNTADDYIKNKPTIPAQKVWYGTCSTSATTKTKVVSTTSGDFKLTAGNLLIVKFSNATTYSGLAELQVDGLTAKEVYYISGTTDDSYRWKGNEIVPFVYNGSVFYMLEQGTATTSYYGMTKLSNSISSTSTSLAATANAVKTAYDEATDATATPTASKKSKFDSSAHMNSTDMTTGADSELEDFIDGLNVSGGGEYIKTVTFTGTMPIKSSGQHWDITFSTGTIPTGYTPIGIISVNTGTSNASISGFYLNGSGIPFAYGKTSGNQSTTASAEAKVLCVKSA